MPLTSVPLNFAVSVSATDASGIARVVFSVDGATRCTVTAAPYNCAVTARNGWHTITAKAFDAAGNTATTTLSVHATPSAHQVTRVLAATPVSGTHVSKTFVVHARAVAANGRPVVFQLDGRARCVDRTAPYACTFRAQTGWHVVAIRTGGSRALHLQLRVG